MKIFWKLSQSLAVSFSILILGLLLSGCALIEGKIIIQDMTTDSGIYQQRTLHDPDGIGKFYMGREIAQVMGYQGASWLERPSRDSAEHPQEIVDHLNVQPTDIIADIGAGTGYLTFRIAPLVPQGKVLAVDAQPEMLELIEALKQETKLTNVETVLGNVKDPNLPPEDIDLALMVDAYHEFEYPREIMSGIVKALKPGGKVVLVEYRKENPLILIKGLHKMSERQVKKEMQAVGLVWRDTKEFLPQQHFLVFEKEIMQESRGEG